MMCGSSTTGETTDDTSKSLNETYRLKYQLLSKRCKEIEQDNERLVNLIYQTYKLYVKGTKRKAILMKRLDSFNDSYRTSNPNVYIELKKEQPSKPKPKIEGRDDVPSSKSTAPVTRVTQSSLPSNASSGTSSSRATSSKKAKNSSNISITSVSNGHQNHHSSSSSSSTCSSSLGNESTPVPPKKPINAYLLFCQMNRSSIQEQLNNDKSGKVDPSNKQELNKALAHHWKVLPPEEKSTYSKLYEIEKEKYDKALKLFNASHCQSVMTNNSNAPSNSQPNKTVSKSLAPIALTHSASAHFTSPNVTVTKVAPCSSGAPAPNSGGVNKISPTCSIVSSASSAVTSIVVTNASTISSLKQQHVTSTLAKSSLLSNVTQNIFHVVPPSTTITPVLTAVSAATATNDAANQPFFTKINNTSNSIIKNRTSANSIIVNGTCTNGLTYTISNNCGTSSSAIVTPVSIVQNGSNKSIDLLATRK